MFKRSSRCSGGSCVEVEATSTAVRVRDTKHDSGPVLTFSPDEWRDFVAGVRLGEFEI